MPNSQFKVHSIGYVKKTEEITCICIDGTYTDALLNIESFSHLIVLWWITGRDNPSDRTVLRVTPKRHPHAPISGVFACRSPARPNPIGLSIVKLESFDPQTNCLIIDRIDAFDETPVIDLKPYFPSSDSIQSVMLPKWFSDLSLPKAK